MNNNPGAKVRVFISYSQESEDHSKKVLTLADRLCKDGIDCNLDQYEQSPPEGWARWMEKQIHLAEYVLVICTETYHKRVNGSEIGGHGTGVSFECLLTYQDIYENYSKNEKFIPVIFKQEDNCFIPKPLKAFQYYLINTDEEYLTLYRKITDQPLIIKPDIGKTKLLPTGINIDKKVDDKMTASSEGDENDCSSYGPANNVLVASDTMEIELKINRDFNNYTEVEKEHLLRAIRELLGVTGDLKIKKIRPGSVRISFELPPEKAEQLFWAVKGGVLEKYNVVDAELRDLYTENFDLDIISPEDKNQWEKHLDFEYHYPLVSRSPEIKEIFSLIKKVAKSNATILIQGETGTGKELIAGLIQFISHRAAKPYVKVNCAALPENLLESELFGHEKGAFTGAYQTRIGKFEQSHEGTLFLDEIGDMHLSTQAKILRVLQDQTFTRLGGNRAIEVDVRVIAATNKDLWAEIEMGNFRADLYYRLNVVTLHIPPLRKRREDIPLIAEYFRRKFSREIRKKTRGFSEESMDLLTNHQWPGNIRELKNLVERAVLVSEEGEEIKPKDLSMAGKDYFAAGGKDRRDDDLFDLNTLTLEKIEKEAILRALELRNWVQKDAAQLLGISPRALNYKINYHGITHPTWQEST